MRTVNGTTIQIFAKCLNALLIINLDALEYASGTTPAFVLIWTVLRSTMANVSPRDRNAIGKEPTLLEAVIQELLHQLLLQPAALSQQILNAQVLVSVVNGNQPDMDMVTVRIAQLAALDTIAAGFAKPTQLTTVTGIKMGIVFFHIMTAGVSPIRQLVFQIMVANSMADLASPKCAQICTWKNPALPIHFVNGTLMATIAKHHNAAPIINLDVLEYVSGKILVFALILAAPLWIIANASPRCQNAIGKAMVLLEVAIQEPLRLLFLQLLCAMVRTKPNAMLI